MIGWLALLGALLPVGFPLRDSAPQVVTVAGVRGESRIPVRTDESGAPVVPAAILMAALDGSARP